MLVAAGLRRVSKQPNKGDGMSTTGIKSVAKFRKDATLLTAENGMGNPT